MCNQYIALPFNFSSPWLAQVKTIRLYNEGFHFSYPMHGRAFNNQNISQPMCRKKLSTKNIFHAMNGRTLNHRITY